MNQPYSGIIGPITWHDQSKRWAVLIPGDDAVTLYRTLETAQQALNAALTATPSISPTQSDS